MNLANKLTMSRLFLIPVFMVFMLVKIPYGDFIAASIFAIGALTDKLDGYIARKYKQITNFGKFMDPLVDKIMVTSALIALVQMGRIESWIVIVIIAREFLITGIRTVAADKGIVIAASNYGKYKTTSQMIAVIALMLNNYPFSLVNFPFDKIMVYIALILTIYSGVDYIVKSKDLFKD
ncbi:MAG: Phosphatidylglycerophosphate synthase [Caldanaerobacter subterraneus]|uniref:CDP-diacylglycerol--glycerol-3-phosphate 3-phosphatidyltransferase n=3 Tax=Caldanaerobacter subterraneus TaxID=911092 RepID=Q8RA53_CALS4|nr:MULTISPECIES: CDP-diacylglycerol--glycerol-3-phosphate 3-phosphatidyltransferase [Caldanaerobacter]AAM24598.1 Phosphatidylglycerophosphate synthase [Caldanaerobacter subterraneus subsp. tengcongensis MB4]KUK09642.1 MAG: Phosphatidylglycerophosphate synthase [Caldanaerobacter subterraneus]MCS3915839.1 CDP-diacylglycerol--glycerol-3-phosphate 3-phosphatidyltransferase [Caldanaerobacter subterraneus subsp. tengcongensis MB4]MDI3518943.1 CDP-diacylglycerol---glycerol-3-phosphate 3-phosphatidyltr